MPPPLCTLRGKAVSMFMASYVSTRLLVQCPVCHATTRVDRAAYSRAQMFCSRDGVPLVVVRGCGPVLVLVTSPAPCHAPACVVPCGV